MSTEKGKPVADVSVIIPAYNAGAFLPRAVRSVWAQTCLPREIIIVDDGSTDDTAQVARSLPTGPGAEIRFAQHADRRNHGVSAARNLGMDLARGEFLAFLDADDEWHPDKLAAQIEFLHRYPTVGLVHTFVEARDDRRDAASPPDGGWSQQAVEEPFDRIRTLEAMVGQRLFLYPSTVVVRVSHLGDMRFVEGLPFQNEDGLFHAMVAARTELRTMRRALCRYHVTSESQLGRVTHAGMMGFIWLDLQIRICRFMRQVGFREAADRLVRDEVLGQMGRCRRQMDSWAKRRLLIWLAFRIVWLFPGLFWGGVGRSVRHRLKVEGAADRQE